MGARGSIPVTLAAALAAALAPGASASFRVDHAFVPGIGRVGTSLPSDTELRPPAEIPRARPVTNDELDRMWAREARLGARVQKGPDAGPRETIEQIKRAVPRLIFLHKVVYTCAPYPKAGLWIYSRVFAGRDRQTRLNWLEYGRRRSKDDEPACEPVRVEFERWHGVRVGPEGRRAQAMLSGRLEFLRRGLWRREEYTVWKLKLRRDGEGWRIAILDQTQPGTPWSSG
jgi:hypothetical protein